jgi:hypothetical protein
VAAVVAMLATLGGGHDSARSAGAGPAANPPRQVWGITSLERRRIAPGRVRVWGTASAPPNVLVRVVARVAGVSGVTRVALARDGRFAATVKVPRALGPRAVTVELQILGDAPAREPDPTARRA